MTGSTFNDVHRILEESGIGLPAYYEWRTRSGCYFCFFQRRAEWVGLMERHPDLFELAKEYEKINPETDERYTWSGKESLEELSRPERVAEIKERHHKAMAARRSAGSIFRWSKCWTRCWKTRTTTSRASFVTHDREPRCRTPI